MGLGGLKYCSELFPALESNGTLRLGTVVFLGMGQWPQHRVLSCNVVELSDPLGLNCAFWAEVDPCGPRNIKFL